MKTYNGEIGIISLTSWKKRIDSVFLTIDSLLSKCPEFHIVLTLSEDEFPRKEKELPSSLNVRVDKNLFEILWIKENFKSLKKILFTMDKYKDVPIISADDDCIYITDYALELYTLWKQFPETICTINAPLNHTNGTSTLYFPYVFGNNVVETLKKNKNLNLFMNADDAYYEILRFRFGVGVSYLPPKKIYITHNESYPLHDIYGKMSYMKMLRKIQRDELGYELNL